MIRPVAAARRWHRKPGAAVVAAACVALPLSPLAGVLGFTAPPASFFLGLAPVPAVAAVLDQPRRFLTIGTSWTQRRVSAGDPSWGLRRTRTPPGRRDAA